MNKGFFLIPLVISIFGCGSSSSTPSSQSVGADVIQKYSLQVEGQPTTTSITLPQQFTDANWGLKEELCQQAGYDLAPHAGQNVSLLRYNLTEKYYPAVSRNIGAGEPLYLWVIAKDQTSVCGYLSVREDSGLIPGVFAVNDPNVKAPLMLSQNATGSTVSLIPGQIVTVSLQGSGATGFTWEVVPGVESILVKRGDSQFVPDSNAVGSAGTYTFTFEAIALGTGSLKLIYHRPWETDVAPLQTFQVTVVIAK